MKQLLKNIFCVCGPGKMLSYLIIFLGMIIFYLYSPYFEKLNPIEYSVSLPLTLEGPMKVNNRLDQVERLYENEIHWPESIAVYKGNIYTGLGDGRIVRLTKKGVEDICRIGEECEGQHQENICGRPLGMRFSKSGTLYVVDAYHGLFAVDVTTGKKKQILPSSESIDGKPLTFLNCLTLDEEEEVIYITQSSTKWNISMVVISLLEHDTTGRLLKYDVKQRTLSVLEENLAFPNGIELSHDKKSLIVAEGGKHGILRYDIKGTDKGKLKRLPIVLPGEPDNISRSPRGNYWVVVGNTRTAGAPTIYDRVSHYPMLRKWFLIMHHFMAFPVSSTLRLIPSKDWKEFASELQTARIFADYSTFIPAIVEFDEKGTVIQSLHSPKAKVSHFSEAQELDGYLYLGSWRNNYLGRVKI